MGDSTTPPTLAEARAAWLEDATFRRLSPATIREYERVSGVLLSHLNADRERAAVLADLKPALVRAWLTSRTQPLKPASVAAYVRSLRAWTRWSASEYGIADPLTGLRLPRVETAAVALFSPNQLRALLETAPPHLAYAVTLLAETGLRVSEAVAADIADIDEAWIRVRRGKGGKARKVPVSGLLARATRTYLGQVRPALVPDDGERLLLASHGRPWTPDSLRLALRRLGMRAGISGVRVSPHTFRHQFAHDVAFGGGSLLALRDALGHSNLAMVARYAVPDDAALIDLLQQRTPLQQMGAHQAASLRRRRVNGEDAG